jgi:hypothetical protein
MTRRFTVPRGSGDTRVLARATLVALALAMASIACAAAPALADSSALNWRTIVLKGAAMPQLVGSPQSHLEVLALHDGRLAPIPFQVDEVLPDGRYALHGGCEALSHDNPGVLDRDDEIAVMLSDFGDRASSPPRELSPDALEVETVDAASGAHRYAYIATVSSPRRSPVSYVSYDPAHSSIEGGSYRMTFRGDFPIGLALKDGRGKFSPSLIDGSQVQVTARVLRLFKLQLSANGVTNRVLAWHGGPIRLIRRVSHSVKLIFGIKSPPVLSEEIFYRDRAEDSFAARVLWLPRLFFSDVRVCTWFDFVGLDGFALSWTGMEWQSLERDMRSAVASEVLRDPPEVKWLALRGGGKVVMQTFTPSPDFATLRRRLYYCDGAAAADVSPHAPSPCEGGALQIGYLMTEWESLAPGTHRVNSVLMILPGSAEPDAVARELDIAPLVTVRSIRR